MDTLTLREVAEQTGVKPATLKRWAETGVIPDVDGGGWTPAAVSHARLVARIDRGDVRGIHAQVLARNGEGLLHYVALLRRLELLEQLHVLR